MAWLLFVDESGQDQRASPYEVLAGVAISDHQLWPLIKQLSDLQTHCFGYRRFSDFDDEAKAKKLLKTKTYKLARKADPIAVPERTHLAELALRDGSAATRQQLAALGQAKLAYVSSALAICRSHGCVAFASIVGKSVLRPDNSDFLRKDYAYLFERYHHFLKHQQNNADMGLVVFDELEKTQSHILLTQMDQYFQKTHKGRSRARLIIPEPLFVHSDLTTMVQIADLVAYIVSWGVRLKGMTAPARPELSELSEIVCELRYHWAAAPNQYDVWGFSNIKSLLPKEKRQ